MTNNFLKCIRCNNQYSIGTYPNGCPNCHDNQIPCNLSYLGVTNLDTILGEHNTPQVEHQQLSQQYGFKVFTKNEFQNPSGSHKDRMSAAFITYAKSIKAKGVVIASSGNAGISLALYADYFDMESVVITSKNAANNFIKALKSTKCKLIIEEDSNNRWNTMKTYVDKGYLPATNFVSPPVGSHPMGIYGYRKIAYELEALKPTHVIIPVSRGDLLYGIYEGFYLLNNIPQLIAVEPFKRIEKVFEGEDYTDTFVGDYSLTPSIGGNSVTYQSVIAIQNSNGRAVSFDFEKLMTPGLYLESSSELCLRALDHIPKDPNNRVVIILTSHGFKNGDCHE